MKIQENWGDLNRRLRRFLRERSQAFKDVTVILVLGIVVFALGATFDIFDKIIAWVYGHDTWQLDEIFTVCLYLLFALPVYAWRRRKEFIILTRRRQHAEAERARLIPELESALDDVSTLKRLLPLCSSCRRVRDDRGYWSQVEEYMQVHYQARFDDGLCPECARKLYSGTELAPAGRKVKSRK